MERGESKELDRRSKRRLQGERWAEKNGGESQVRKEKRNEE